MCGLLITRLLRGVGRWARKPVNHTSWVAVVTPTDRPKSVRNRCLIELFCGVVCVVALSFWHFCWCITSFGFCHRTGSDLFLFVIKVFFHINLISRWYTSEKKITRLCFHDSTIINFFHCNEGFILLWVWHVDRGNLLLTFSSILTFFKEIQLFSWIIATDIASFRGNLITTGPIVNTLSQKPQCARFSRVFTCPLIV